MNFLFNLKRDETAITTATNRAIVTAKGLPPISTEVSFLLEKSSDLTITQTTNKFTVHPGENLTYTIVITNNGPSNAARVFLIDVLPEDCDLVSVVLTEGSYRISNGLIKCKLGELAKGHSVALTITITPRIVRIIQNFARVASKTYDPNPNNNTSINDTIVNALESRPRGIKYF